MAAGSEGSLRVLLILSAIDLLSSAVTAGLVLFVVLVGADAGASKGDATASSGTGMNQVEVVSLKGEAELFKIGKPSPSVVDADKYEMDFFEGSPKKLPRKFYLIPSSQKRLTVAQVKAPVELVVQPISGSAVRLFIRCLTGQDKIELSIEPLVLPECIAMPGDEKTLQVSAGSTLFLPPNQAIPGLPKEERHTAGFAKYKLTGPLVVPKGVLIWGIIP